MRRIRSVAPPSVDAPNKPPKPLTLGADVFAADSGVVLELWSPSMRLRFSLRLCLSDALLFFECRDLRSLSRPLLSPTSQRRLLPLVTPSLLSLRLSLRTSLPWSRSLSLFLPSSRPSRPRLLRLPSFLPLVASPLLSLSPFVAVLLLPFLLLLLLLPWLLLALELKPDSLLLSSLLL